MLSRVRSQATLRFQMVGVMAVTALGFVTVAGATTIQVTVENLAPSGGTFLTPVWVSLHDGSFDFFSQGNPLTPGGGLEQLAEDGPTGPLGGEFEASPAFANGGRHDTILAPAGFGGAPVLDPGDSGSVTFMNADPVMNRYLSYASMVIPSNDAFIGNDNPTGIELFDAGGNFLGPLSIVVAGSMVWDAGTELNDEMEAAFINQTGAGNGTVTNDGVAPHPGFIGSLGNPGGTPIILGGTTAAGTLVDSTLGDFTQPGHQIALISIVPEPATVALVGVGGLILARRRRRAA